VKTLECHPTYMKLGWSISQLKDKIVDSSEKSKLKMSKEEIINIAVETKGKVTPTVVDDVYEIEITAKRETRRGRCKTVAKYFRDTGRKPDASEVNEKVCKLIGKLIQYVKIYDGDEEEWDFSEEEGYEIQRRKQLHHGESEEAARDLYQQACKGTMSHLDPKKKGITKLKFENAVGEKNAKDALAAMPPAVVSVAGQGSTNAGKGGAVGAAALEAQAAAAEDAAEREMRLLESVAPLELKLKGRQKVLEECERAEAKKRKAEGPAGDGQGNAGKPSAKKKARKTLSGAALTRAMEAAEKLTKEGRELQAKIQACRNLESFKKCEGDLKDLTGQMPFPIERCRCFLATRCVSIREL
jgi:hypothetical protein